MKFSHFCLGINISNLKYNYVFSYKVSRVRKLLRSLESPYFRGFFVFTTFNSSKDGAIITTLFLLSLHIVYNKAIKQKVIERSHYPFYDISIKSEKTVKRAILGDDICKLEQILCALETAPRMPSGFFNFFFNHN